MGGTPSDDDLRRVSMTLWSLGPEPVTHVIHLQPEDVELIDLGADPTSGYSSRGFDGSQVHAYVKRVLQEWFAISKEDLHLLALCGEIHWDAGRKLRCIPNDPRFVRPAEDFKVLHVFHGPKVSLGPPVLQRVSPELSSVDRERRIYVETASTSVSGRETAFVAASSPKISPWEIKMLVESEFAQLAVLKFGLGIFVSSGSSRVTHTTYDLSDGFDEDMMTPIETRLVSNVVLYEFVKNGVLCNRRRATALIARRLSASQLTSEAFTEEKECDTYRNHVWSHGVFQESKDRVGLVRDAATGGLRPVDSWIPAPGPSIRLYIIESASTVTRVPHPHARSSLPEKVAVAIGTTAEEALSAKALTVPVKITPDGKLNRLDLMRLIARLFDHPDFNLRDVTISNAETGRVYSGLDNVDDLPTFPAVFLRLIAHWTPRH